MQMKQGGGNLKGLGARGLLRDTIAKSGVYPAIFEECSTRIKQLDQATLNKLDRVLAKIEEKSQGDVRKFTQMLAKEPRLFKTAVHILGGSILGQLLGIVLGVDPKLLAAVAMFSVAVESHIVFKEPRIKQAEMILKSIPALRTVARERLAELEQQ